MIWNGKQLQSKEDFGRALLTLTGKADALAFKQVFSQEFTEEPEKVLGYLTAEVAQPKQKAIREFLEVSHPSMPEGSTIEEIYAIGLALGEEIKRTGTMPVWLKVVLSMPRESPDLFYDIECRG